MTASDRPSRKPSRWKSVLLFVSLGLNLLVAGAILGAALGRGGEGGPRDRWRAARDLGPPSFVLALDRQDRRALSSRLMREGGGRADRAAVRARLDQSLRALRNEPFDPTALASLLEEQRNHSKQRQTDGARMLIGHLAAMSPDERRAYADRLERVLNRRGGG